MRFDAVEKCCELCVWVCVCVCSISQLYIQGGEAALIKNVVSCVDLFVCVCLCVFVFVCVVP